MLAFLDAGVNIKGAPNENFAREIMELFTMGVGNYSENDIREAARAFTGWNFSGLEFQISSELHDDTEKIFLGKSGRFDGVDVIDIEQPKLGVPCLSQAFQHFFVDLLAGFAVDDTGFGINQFVGQILPV